MTCRRWVERVALGLVIAAAAGCHGPDRTSADVPNLTGVSYLGHASESPSPVPTPLPAPAPYDRPLPINLPSALALAGVRPLDVALASERIGVAAAELQRAEVRWLPTLLLGADYYRHDGRIQDVTGNLFDTGKSTVMVGAAPYAVFAVTDAVFGPLAARQDVRARGAALQVARNDSMLAVAEAYFNVQQARGELAGAAEVSKRSDDLVRKAGTLVTAGLVPPLEVTRAEAEAARRRQATHAALERWRSSSAELNRVLRLDASAVVEPLEPPHLRVTLIEPCRPLEELIPLALVSRPELESQRALVEATAARLRQEKWRPLIPSVLLRGASTNPAGTLAVGSFGGGRNGFIGNFAARGDIDVQLLWELQNLGLGNIALVNARSAENRIAVLELFRTQERVAAEVTQAYAQVQSAAARTVDAAVGLRKAAESANRSLEGMEETNRIGGTLVLVIRPQEVVASVQSLAQAFADYYGAVGDYDRAQFRLYRALGHPAQCLRVSSCQAPTDVR